MTKGRTWPLIGVLLALFMAGCASGGGGRPPIDPPPPEGPLQSLEIIVHEEHAVGLLGALVTLDDGQTRTTGGEGHVQFDVRRSHDVVIRATGYYEYRTTLAPWDRPHMVYLTPDPEWRPKALNIVVHGDGARPLGGAVVTLNNGVTGSTDTNGFVSLAVWRDHDLTIQATGYIDYATNLAPWVDVAGVPQSHQVFLTREKPEPGQNPWPVAGRIRVLDGNQCFADDSGCRGFAGEHTGDMFARWVVGPEGEAKVSADLDDIAAVGYQAVRPWWHLRANAWPWNQGGDPHYNGLDALSTPNYVEKGIAFCRAVAARGMRVAMGPGGLDQIGRADEERIFHQLRQIADGCGHANVFWVEGVNEPSSIHATTDNNGDNQPDYLASLARIVANGTGIPFHAGYWDNNNYQDTARYCVDGQVYNYNHGWRGGNGGNKIDRRTTWIRVFEHESRKPHCRLTIDGESVGWPVTGSPLRYVSATANGHELASPELQGLIAAATALRGIPFHMSGTGVQRYEPFTQTVGFRQVPWIVNTLPREVHRWTVLHGGMSDSRLVFRATTNSNGILGRVEQAVSSSGEFAAIAYNYQRPNESQSFELARTATFKVCDVAAMTCSDERTLQRGQRYEMTAEWGRVLIGRAQ